uniref:L-cysteine--[L-cysteinyl-carrier protein] ligase n=1 Tax=Phaselicystis flava TaxID=525924 RepID=A0A3S7V076_9BACT|nr:nonribosomal peptide synthetase [Phaselicystis flava]
MIKAERLSRLSPEKRALVEKRLRGELHEGAAPSGIPRGPVGQPAPLSFSQQRLWFVQQLDRESVAYNETAALRLSGPLDVSAFERVIQEIVRRHEILRTTFAAPEGKPVQIVAEDARAQVVTVDLRPAPGADPEEEIRRRIEIEAARPFDLEIGPLLRVTLLALSPEDHVVVFANHHIVSDAWSRGILLREIAELYGAFSKGQPSPLPELSIHYVDFARWQRSTFDSDALKAQLGYWRRQLGGSLPILDLPTDRPRPATAAHRGGALPVHVPKPLVEALEALGRGERATLFMTVLAAFGVLLRRYSGQEDILIGAPTTTRSRAQLEPLIGFFVNSLVLRLDLSAAPSFRELLRQAREVATSAYANQDVPFERLVEELQPRRDPSRPPLFQAMLAMQNAPAQPLRIPGLSARLLEAHLLTARLDLTLDLAPTEDGLAGVIEYSAELFDAPTIERMAAHFLNLLRAIVADPDQPITDLPLLSADERRRLLVEWNDTALPCPDDRCFHELFEAQVERAPDAVAAVFEDRQLSYRELNAHANRLAHRLVALGVGPDVVVGLLMDRGLELLVSVLAVFKAGGAYLPLDPEHPAHRHLEVLARSGAPLVLTTGAYTASLSSALAGASIERRPEILPVEGAVTDALPAESPAPRVTPSHLAYVIYTSGSTGVPKGAMVEHRGMLNHLYAKVHTLHLGAGDCVAQNASQCFDISVWQMLSALLVGGRVRILPNEVAHAPRRLFEEVDRGGLSILEVVPSLLRMALDDLEAGGCARPRLDTLRWLVPTGEALPPELVNRWLSLFPAIPLLNAYGPTECSDDVAHHPIHAPLGRDVVHTPIGRPILNTQLYVLDHRLQPVPIGVAGELYVGGAGVGRGYLNDAQRTAEAFLEDPFSSRAGARFYRTGDLVRYRANGALEFLGRVDHQVKIRGYRIELGEIESALARVPGVREAVVTALDDASGSKQLVAYVVRRAQDELSRADLRGALGERLPAYMIPNVVVELDALPLTPNGKIDRRALPRPEGALAAPTVEFTAPRTHLEQQLAAIWGEVLSHERVGVHDDFFELGGHSLLAAQIVARARAALGVEIPLRRLLESPTIAGVASFLEEESAETPRDAALVLVPDEARRFEPFPLTDVQHAYWIGRRGIFELGNVACHFYVEFEARDLDLGRLSAAWQRVIARHEMLRAVVQPDGQQRILEHTAPYVIQVEDLTGEPAAAREARLEAIRRELSHQVLPADRWPLFDVRASRIDARRTRLHFSIDTLMADGTSKDLVIRDLSRWYADPDAELPPLSLSFRDYVLAMVADEGSDAYARSLAYWHDRLASLPPAPELPLAHDPGSIDATRFVRREAQLAPERWSRLKRRAQQAGLTPSGVVLAVYAEVLAAWSASPRFTLNLTLFNRQPVHPQVGEIVGDFTSLTMLAVDQQTDASFEVRAKRLQRQLWADLDHRRVSGVRVLRDLARRGVKAKMPVVFTSELGLDMADELAESQSFEGEVTYAITQTPQVWLDHQVRQLRGALNVSWDAVEELFPPGLLQDMFDAYVALLNRLADDERAWQQVERSLIPPRQLAARNEVNRTEAPVPAGLLHEPFLSQARERPEHPAVIDGDRILTYGELHARALSLGRELRARGLRPNQLAAVVMEKGWEQVVAVLAILIAGGAYLPIDPDLPADRVRFMLENGEVELALTQARVDERAAWPDAVARIRVDEEAPRSADAAPLEPTQAAGDLAYVIFTSGSTGLPKGVMIDHRGALNTVADVDGRFGVGPADRVLALSSLSFDLSVYDVFGTLAAGGTIVMPGEGAKRDAARWAEIIRRERVTVWSSVPALMEMLVAQAAGQPESLGGSLRLVMLSGDWIPVGLPDQIRALLPNATLISMGGATEASIWSILYPIGAVDPSWKSIPYGAPMVNQSFHVLDDAMAPRPTWVPGRLYIGGVGLAKGYWRDEEKTRARFVVHPKTGERLYHTGDLGRYLPDGNIEFLGREDFQVKIQGYRIELGEIEAMLGRHPDVREVAVSVAPDRSGARRLVAYVVPRATLDEAHEEAPAPGAGAPPALDVTAQGVIVDPIERLKFKLRRPALRDDLAEEGAIDLGAPAGSDDLLARFEARRSHQRFSAAPITLADFGVFLASLMEVSLNGLPKLRYPSAGGLYPVQIYLYIKRDRVEGVGEGTYYYHPRKHRLVPISRAASIDRTAYTDTNRSIFDSAAFAIFLMSKPAAIAPLYGELAGAFSLLEAGYLGQLLMTEAAEQGLGLCPVGSLDFERVRAHFALGADQVLLHSLLGGRALPPGAGAAERPAASHAGSPTEALVSALREHAERTLPDYMVPSAVMILPALPLTSNGKVDRRALPRPEQVEVERRNAYVAPRNEAEATLAGIWREVLNLAEVGVEDDFFEIGGDSLLAIRIISRAAKVGIRLTPLRFFESLTIARMLAADAPLAAPEASASGPVPLTQNQHESFDTHDPDRHLWNTSLLFKVHPSVVIDAALLERAAQGVVDHHDALRLRSIQEGSRWRQIIEPPGCPSRSFTRVDLSSLAETEQRPAMEAATFEIQGSLDLSEGPLLRVVLFDCGAGRPSFLYVIVHHTSVDAFSMDVLADDLMTAYQQLARSEELRLPPHTTPLKRFAERMHEHAQSEPSLREAEYWLSEPRLQVRRLPVDHPGGVHTGASASTLRASLDVDTSRRLFDAAPAYGASLEDLLLTALAHAFRRWSGNPTTLVDLVNNGRTTPFDDVDLSRTVGWFSYLTPMLLDAGEASDPKGAVRAVQRQHHGVPNRGFGYGLLRYVTEDPEIAARMRAAPRSEVFFNFRGGEAEAPRREAGAGELLGREPEVPYRHSQSVVRRHAFLINCQFEAGRLQIEWMYSRNLHRGSTVEALIARFFDALRELADHAGPSESSSAIGIGARA